MREEDMAYFDSPKNRVLWEMELKDLRRQRADFEAGKLEDFTGSQMSADEDRIHRKPVSLEHLEKEEAISVSARRAARPTREREMGKTMERGQPAPQRSREAALKPRTPQMKAKIGKGG